MVPPLSGYTAVPAFPTFWIGKWGYCEKESGRGEWWITRAFLRAQPSSLLHTSSLTLTLFLFHFWEKKRNSSCGVEWTDRSGHPC